MLNKKYEDFKRKMHQKIVENEVKSNRQFNFTDFSNFLNAENAIQFKEDADENFGLHYRVSTSRQAEDGESLETQELMAKKVVKENKGKVYKEYLEDGVSASKKKLSQRSQMLQLLDDFQDGNFKNIVSYNQDRLFRNEKEAPSILLFLLMNGVTIYYTRGGNVKKVNKETLGDFGLIEIMFLAKKAREESQATSERVADNRRNIFIKGHIVQSYIPYGYIRDKDKKVVQVEDEVEMIKQIEDFYLSGIGYSTIAKWLNGEKTKKLGKRISKFNRRKIRKDDSDFWTKETVEGLLFNEFYHGILVNNFHGQQEERVVSKDHIPFRTKERYEQLVKFKNEKKKKKLPPRHYDSNFLLKGMLFCKNCGEKFYTRTTTRSNGKEASEYYLCKGSIDGQRIGSHICNTKSYNKQMLETFVLLKVKNYLSKIDLSLLTNDIAKAVNKDDKKLILEVDNLDKQISQLKKEERGLKRDIRITNAEIDDEKDEEIINELEEELKDLKNDSREIRKEIKKIEDLRSQLADEIENQQMVEFETTHIFNKMREFVDDFENMVDYRKQVLLEQIIDTIWLDNDGNIEINYTVPLDELVESVIQMAVSSDLLFFGDVGELTPPKNNTDLENIKALYINDFDHIDDSNFYHWVEEIYIEARSKFKEFLIGTTLKFTETGRINAWQLANKTGITHYTAKAYFNYSHFPTKEKMIQILKPFNSSPKDFVKYLNLDNYIDSNLLFEIITCVNRWYKTESINETKIGQEIKLRVEKYKEKNTLNRQVIYSTRNVIVEEWVEING
jgi:site-specific DNA recombinase